MAFIHRDFLTPKVFRWNMYSKLYQRFKRVWGTHIDNGIECYNTQLIFWDSSTGVVRNDKPFNRFINILGLERAELTKQDYEGAKNVYFKFDLSKLSFDPLTNAEIGTKLRNAFNPNDEFELSITYTGKLGRVLPEQYVFVNTLGDNDTNNILNYNISTEAIRNTLHSDPMKYFFNGGESTAGTTLFNVTQSYSPYILNQSPTSTTSTITPLTVVKPLSIGGTLHPLALLDNGTTFQNMGVTDEHIAFNDDAQMTIRYSYKIRYKVLTEPADNSYIVSKVAYCMTLIKNAYSTKKSSPWTRVSAAIQDTSLKTAIYSMVDLIPPTSLVYNGKLRVDACAAMKREDFGLMLSKILTTDYEEEDAEWYEVVIAILLIVISIAVTIISFGTAAAGVSPLMALATSLAMGTAVLSIGLYIYATAFPTAMDMIRLIGGVAQIMGLAASIAGLFNMLSNIFKQIQQQALQQYLQEVGTKGMSEGAIKQLSEQFIENYGIKDMIGDMFDHLFDTISEKLSSMLDFSKLFEFTPGDLSELTMKDISGWMSNIGKAMDLYMEFNNSSADEGNKVEKEQAEKEDGVEAYFGTLNMIDEVDALSRMDRMMQSSLGLNKTEEFLVKIY